MVEFKIVVLPGDGIGGEVIAPSLEVLDAACGAVGGLNLHYETLEAGARVYRERGVAMSDETVKLAEAADAILLGAMGLPEVRYPDGREIAPQVDLRELWGLFAGVRPVRPAVEHVDVRPRPDGLRRHELVVLTLHVLA